MEIPWNIFHGSARGQKYKHFMETPWNSMWNTQWNYRETRRVSMEFSCVYAHV